MLGSSNQSLLTSFISRVAAGPSVTKWTSNFTRLVERCCKATPDRAGPLLIQMEEWLVPNKFENVCTQSQEDLLNLWECSLRISSERAVQQMHREVAFGLILLLMQRDDFSLTQESLEDIRIWYNRLLLATFDRATVLLKFNSKSVGEVQFAATALAVFFFRLPLVSTMVVDALQTKPKETRRDNGFWSPEPSSGLPCSIGASGGPGRRRSSAARLSSPAGIRGEMSPVGPPQLSSTSPTGEETASPGAPSVRKSRLSLRLAEKAALNAAESNSSNHEGSKTPSSPPRTPQRSPATKESTIETPTSSLRRLTEEWNDTDKKFVDANPDLFLWNASLLDSDHTTLVFNHVLDATPYWAKWLSTKESFFLSFAEMFVTHVQRCANGQSNQQQQQQQQQPVNIRWKLVPGYDLLLSCFFPLLRSAIWWDSIAKRTPGQGAGWVTSLQGYMRVKRTACSLLQADRSLLPGFVRCAFECTNLHSLLSVDSGIEHLNLFFASSAVIRTPPADAFTAAPRGIATTSSSKNESLPESFDYESFWECFAKLLESESYQVLLKCCSFLYNNMHLFYGKNRTKIVNDLLRPRLFFRLFLHWSPEVRTCFHHLIVYKILRADRRYLPCFSDSQVMLLYGTSGNGNGKSSKSGAGGGKKTPVTSPRVAVSAKAAWGKQDELVMTAPSMSPTSPPPSSSPSFQSLQESSSPPNGSNNRNNGGNPQDAPATAEEIAQLTRSAQRRLSLFDRANATDDEELWSDMAFSSKIDSFVRMCLSFRDKDGGGVPKELLVYVEPALEQYSLLLIRYYRGATLASLDEIPDTLSHRMMLSEFTESIG